MSNRQRVTEIDFDCTSFIDHIDAFPEGFDFITLEGLQEFSDDKDNTDFVAVSNLDDADCFRVYAMHSTGKPMALIGSFSTRRLAEAFGLAVEERFGLRLRPHHLPSATAG